MQRIRRPRTLCVRSNGSVHRDRESAAPDADRVTSPTGVKTLASALGQALPSLDGVQTAYDYELHAELLFELCGALVREGLGTGESWSNCGESATAFVQHSITEGIGETRWNLIQRNAEYYLQVSDVGEQDGYDASIGDGQLALTIECSGSGYLKIGPAIETLEEEAEGLGAAFYWMLTHALYRVMRIYNHDDALEYEARLKECAEEDDEANKDQYEFPEVERALPECIRKTLKCKDPGWSLDARRLLRRFRNGRYGSWIERLQKIQRLSRLHLKQSRNLQQQGNYDSPPLPCVLIAFKEHDAISACFDEEGQYMLEGSSEPTVGVIFSPQKPEEVRQAMRITNQFIALNYEFFLLVEELHEWERRYAGTDLDRGEPSLRAA